MYTTFGDPQFTQSGTVSILNSTTIALEGVYPRYSMNKTFQKFNILSYTFNGPVILTLHLEYFEVVKVLHSDPQLCQVRLSKAHHMRDGELIYLYNGTRLHSIIGAYEILATAVADEIIILDIYICSISTLSGVLISKSNVMEGDMIYIDKCSAVEVKKDKGYVVTEVQNISSLAISIPAAGGKLEMGHDHIFATNTCIYFANAVVLKSIPSEMYVESYMFRTFHRFRLLLKSRHTLGNESFSRSYAVSNTTYLPSLSDIIRIDLMNAAGE